MKTIDNTSRDNGQATGTCFNLHDLTSDPGESNPWATNEGDEAGYRPERASTTGLGPG